MSETDDIITDFLIISLTATWGLAEVIKLLQTTLKFKYFSDDDDISSSHIISTRIHIHSEDRSTNLL